MRRPSFEDVYARFSDELAMLAVSRQHRIPRMTAEEVHAEMLLCLWNAKRTYIRSHGTSFGAYWWAVWRRREADLIRDAFRDKRDASREALAEMTPGWWSVMDGVVGNGIEDRVPPPPPTDDDLERQVWYLLASGAERQDVCQWCGITRRTYYNILLKWRNDDVRDILVPDACRDSTKRRMTIRRKKAMKKRRK